MTTPKTPSKRSGPPTFFPDKVRVPTPVQLTAHGHESVAANLERLRSQMSRRLSRSDYFEALELAFGRRLAPEHFPKVA